jgi:fatty acid desaturase
MDRDAAKDPGADAADAAAAAAHPDWFREPSRREHLIAAALFVGFGAFFVCLFWVQRHWWFRWVILGLGLFSVWHGLRHALDARHGRQSGNPKPE